MAKLLNWPTFEGKIKERRLPVFTSLDVRRVFGSSRVATTFLLHRYYKRGLIIRLRRGLYMLRDSRVSDLYVANKLYEPSYVSLEFALSYHRVIPETVYEITSITTRATKEFSVQGKRFTYRHIMKKVFTGYSTGQIGGLVFLIADPEKAFVDLNYLRVLRGKQPISRFDKEKINYSKAVHYAKLFDNSKLIGVINRSLQQ